MPKTALITGANSCIVKAMARIHTLKGGDRDIVARK